MHLDQKIVLGVKLRVIVQLGCKIVVFEAASGGRFRSGLRQRYLCVVYKYFQKASSEMHEQSVGPRRPAVSVNNHFLLVLMFVWIANGAPVIRRFQFKQPGVNTGFIKRTRAMATCTQPAVGTTDPTTPHDD